MHRTVFTCMFLILLVAMIISNGQPPDWFDQSTSISDSWDHSSPEPYIGWNQGTAEPYPKYNSSLINHPLNGPLVVSVPKEIPPAFEGNGVPYIFHGVIVSLEDLRRIGGNVSPGNGLQYYILYNKTWCQHPTAYWSSQQTNAFAYIDRPQYIWLYEKLPYRPGRWNDLGGCVEGYLTFSFSAYKNERGWHQIALWGNKSGWSNVLWVYIR